MARYCPIVNRKVIYQFCEDCDDRICENRKPEIPRDNPFEERSILLNTIDKVRNFVEIIMGFDEQIDIQSGRYVVSAKSILGIFSLDLSRKLLMRIYADKERSKEILERIEKYLIEE